MMKTKPGKTAYWILTLLVALPFFASGIAYVAGAAPVTAGLRRLGYPLYLTSFIGVAKLLAVLAIVVGKFPRIKEWAYAGLIFDTIGALYSHLRSDQTREAIPAAVILVVLIASYSSWKAQDIPKSA